MEVMKNSLDCSRITRSQRLSIEFSGSSAEAGGDPELSFLYTSGAGKGPPFKAMHS